MSTTLTRRRLRRQSRHYEGRGGVSREARPLGFRPAFMDTETRCVYLSRFADGSVAPFHLLDGLPENLVTKRDEAGHVACVCDHLIAGFVLDERFYTRDEAALLVSAKPCR